MRWKECLVKCLQAIGKLCTITYMYKYIVNIHHLQLTKALLPYIQLCNSIFGPLGYAKLNPQQDEVMERRICFPSYWFWQKHVMAVPSILMGESLILNTLRVRSASLAIASQLLWRPGWLVSHNEKAQTANHQHYPTPLTTRWRGEERRR